MVHHLIIERDGPGDPLPDPVCRKFEVVESGGFGSPILAVLRDKKPAFALPSHSIMMHKIVRSGVAVAGLSSGSLHIRKG